MCSPLHCTTFSRRRRHSLILCSRNACDSCCHTATNCTSYFLHRLETPAVVNHPLKRSPNSIFNRIQIWVVWWSQCHVRLDEWHSHVNCFWRCETARDVLLQRPLVMAAPCTDTGVRNFLITNIDCWPWPLVLKTQRLSCLSCARDVDRHSDVGVLCCIIKWQAIHQVAPLQRVKCMNSDIMGMFTIHVPWCVQKFV